MPRAHVASPVPAASVLHPGPGMLEVLLVDDDEIVRASIAEALVGQGHRVTEAEDGQIAVNLLGKRSFDLALCDVQLPKIDGLSLLHRIRSSAPDTDVILMTSFA